MFPSQSYFLLDIPGTSLQHSSGEKPLKERQQIFSRAMKTRRGEKRGGGSLGGALRCAPLRWLVRFGSALCSAWLSLRRPAACPCPVPVPAAAASQSESALLPGAGNTRGAVGRSVQVVLFGRRRGRVVHVASRRKCAVRPSCPICRLGSRRECCVCHVTGYMSRHSVGVWVWCTRGTHDGEG